MAIKQTNILLESDTNELEIVEFRVDEYDHHGNLVPCHYGVNVAKVREIIRLPEVTKSLNSVDAIEGMIKLREKVITVLNLARILNKDTGDMQADRVIVLEFNNLMVGGAGPLGLPHLPHLLEKRRGPLDERPFRSGDRPGQDGRPDHPGTGL